MKGVSCTASNRHEICLVCHLTYNNISPEQLYSSVENTTPRIVNVTRFQSRLISGINLNFEFLRDPIHTALVLLTLIFRPYIEANSCKTHIHEQNDSLVPSRKKVVSSANCDNNISSSRMFIPCMFSF